MKIKWLGHSCFLITGGNGVRILTDPFDETVGYQLPAVEADIVTSSHDHFDHNHIGVVKGDFVHLNEPGPYRERDIEIRGIGSYHDDQGGQKRGDNIIFTFRFEGISVCHLGDLGHLLEDEQIRAIGPVDILLVPVGGTYTIDYRQAVDLIGQLEPKLVIPMHYKTPAMGFDIDGVDKFLKEYGVEAYEAGSQEIDLSATSLNDYGRVILLNYE